MTRVRDSDCDHSTRETGELDAVTSELCVPKTEMVRLAETVLRMARVLDPARFVDRDTRLLLDAPQPEIDHAPYLQSLARTRWSAGLTELSGGSAIT